MGEVFVQPAEVEWLEENVQVEVEVASEQLNFPKLDGIVFPIVAANADVVAPCSWMDGAEVSLSNALNNYPQVMSEENADQVIEDVNEFLANRVQVVDEPEVETDEETVQGIDGRIDDQMVQATELTNSEPPKELVETKARILPEPVLKVEVVEVGIDHEVEPSDEKDIPFTAHIQADRPEVAAIPEEKPQPVKVEIDRHDRNKITSPVVREDEYHSEVFTQNTKARTRGSHVETHETVEEVTTLQVHQEEEIAKDHLEIKEASSSVGTQELTGSNLADEPIINVIPATEAVDFPVMPSLEKAEDVAVVIEKTEFETEDIIDHGLVTEPEVEVEFNEDVPEIAEEAKTVESGDVVWAQEAVAGEQYQVTVVDNCAEDGFPITQSLENIQLPEVIQSEAEMLDQVLPVIERINQVIEDTDLDESPAVFIDDDKLDEYEGLREVYVELFEYLGVEYLPETADLLSVFAMEMQVAGEMSTVFGRLSELDEPALCKLIRRASGGGSVAAKSIKRGLSKALIVGRSALRQCGIGVAKSLRTA